ncbi:MAG TPA: type II secretion system protein [Phycisphaerae bacterium]|nr:type II secretion system protein [Phycisphaerae bacterium]
MKKGFTLVELLVVIAIIAILLMLMAPSVSTMLERTRRNVCANNQHGMGSALAHYSAAYKTFLAFPNWRAPETAGIWVDPGWLYCQRDLSGGWRVVDMQKGAFWEYIGRLEAYRCPEDKGPYVGTQIMTSYLMNGSVISYGRDWGSGNVNPLHRSIDFGPLDVIIWEATGPAGDWNDGSSFPREGLASAHREGAVFACADGHAEYMSREQINREVAGQYVYDRMVAAGDPSPCYGPTLLWNNPRARDGR